MHACMHGCRCMTHAVRMWTHVCMQTHTHTHIIHLCICIHARMYACWHAYACRHAHTRTQPICIHTHMYVCGHTQCIYGYVSMVQCGWMAYHTCGHVCTCACGGVLMVPVSGFLCRCCQACACLIVSLSGTHAPQNVSAWDSCVAVWVCRMHIAFATRGRSACWGGASCVVDRGSCMQMRHAHVRCCTRGGCLLPRSHPQEGGACWAGAPWVVDHACMCTTHVHPHACTQHIHVHAMLTHAHSCCMLITCTHTHTHTYIHACLVACSSHTHLHMYACNTHTHACRHAYMCNTPRSHTACGCCIHIHLELYPPRTLQWWHNHFET